MLLETFGRNTRPLFLTWTFRPSSYQDDSLYVLKSTQDLYKRLRRMGHDIRYFQSIERGTKNGRLHAHSVIYSDSLRKMSWTDTFWTLLNTWGHGAIKVRVVRSPGAFHYVSKYLVKDLIHESDPLTGEWQKSCRNYQFSNRPGFGSNGIERWKEITEKMFHVEQMPPNWFNMPFLGQLEKAYIPTDPYKKFVKEQQIKHDLTVTEEKLDNFLESINDTIVDDVVKKPVTTWIDENFGYLDG